MWRGWRPSGDGRWIGYTGIIMGVVRCEGSPKERVDCKIRAGIPLKGFFSLSYLT